ncbi:GNAT family N-acetyltransferase [Lacticaseibacillus parakribbianus]|uniref:GNAT family N-acetyltransferase n=1 Tax=Lacticaseibacillus parakribbianus TaxID=2970927 RepID=UPI0030B81051
MVVNPVHRDPQPVTRLAPVTLVVVPVAARTAALTTALVAVWRQSVTATHHFLDAAAIAAIAPVVPAALATVPVLIVAQDAAGRPLGFAGIAEAKLEMLFLAPAALGRGLGRRLVATAVERFGVATVTVNAQNPAALGFYRHMGFAVTGRSATDEQGGPYPVLFLRRRSSGAWAEAQRLARGLNRVGIRPYLLGSLAAGRLLGRDFAPHDIDWQLRAANLRDWRRVTGVMVGAGYHLVDPHERAFRRGPWLVGFGDVETLAPYAGVDYRTFTRVTAGGATLNLPTQAQLAAVYRASVQDAWRAGKPKDRRLWAALRGGEAQ